MDFGFSDRDGERFANHQTRHVEVEPSPRPALTFSQMLDQIERTIDADPAIAHVFAARFAHRFSAPDTAKVSLAPFPADFGTVLTTIWDNQPGGKRSKVEGDSSRDKPARYAIDIRATVAGHARPLTTNTPDFRANVGDLFTPDEIRKRIKRAWRGIDDAEVSFLDNEVLPVAEDNGFLVARLSLKRAAAKGGGTHWHPYHYALVSSEGLESKAVPFVMLIIGRDRTYMLPECSTLDSSGKPFPVVNKTTKSGSSRQSIVLGQSRATDLKSSKMEAWATGEIRVPKCLV